MELWEAGQIWSTPRYARNSPFWNSRIKVSEPTRICEPADLFVLPSFHLKLPQLQFPYCRLPPPGSEQGRTYSWAISYQAAIRNTDFPCLPAGMYSRWTHGKLYLCIPSGLFTPLLSRTWVQMYHICFRRESEAFGFSLLTLKLHYWLPVTCLQAWLILCKTEDFTAILQKDLKPPDFPYWSKQLHYFNVKGRKLRSISPRKYYAAIRNNNHDLIFLKAGGPNMWQFLYSSTAKYLCVKLLLVVDLQGSKNVSSGYLLKKINKFVLQNLGKTLSVPRSFAFSTLSGSWRFNSPLNHKEWRRLGTQSVWKFLIHILNWLRGEAERLNGWEVKMSEECFEGRFFFFFSCRELGVSCGVMFCHDASPQRQKQPTGSEAEKWWKNEGF